MVWCGVALFLFLGEGVCFGFDGWMEGGMDGGWMEGGMDVLYYLYTSSGIYVCYDII